VETGKERVYINNLWIRKGKKEVPDAFSISETERRIINQRKINSW
jgi:hypothetical protein